MDLFPQDSVFHQRKMSKWKAPVYRSAAREKTKHQVKDEVILNSQSNPVDTDLVELESVNIPCQEYVFLSITSDKAEVVKNKQEFLTEQIKDNEEEVKRLMDVYRFRGRNLKKNLLKK